MMNSRAQDVKAVPTLLVAFRHDTLVTNPMISNELDWL